MFAPTDIRWLRYDDKTIYKMVLLQNNIQLDFSKGLFQRNKRLNITKTKTTVPPTDSQLLSTSFRPLILYPLPFHNLPYQFLFLLPFRTFPVFLLVLETLLFFNPKVLLIEHQSVSPVPDGICYRV